MYHPYKLGGQSEDDKEDNMVMRRIDDDRVWVDGEVYISLNRVGEMIEEDRQSRKMGTLKMNVSLDMTEANEAIAKLNDATTKAKELNGILKELHRRDVRIGLSIDR